MGALMAELLRFYGIWLVEFFLVLLVCLLHAPKRPLFVLRVLGIYAAALLVSSLIPMRDDALFNSSMFFIIAFLSMILTGCLCFDLDIKSGLFYAMIAYSIQHIPSALGGVYNTLLGAWLPLPDTVIKLLSYSALFLLLRKQVYQKERISISGIVIVSLAIIMILVEIILSDIIRIEKAVSYEYTYYLVFSLMDLLSAVAMIVLLINMVQRKSLEEELLIVQQLHNREKQQYQISKDVIDMINIKCHDMRHQIRHIGTTVDPAVIQDMEQTINFYDMFIKTGNETLDTIMAEKGLVCQHNGITINCIADGGALSFMQEVDIYSLFGNLMDNAITAVMDLEPDKRAIGLTVRAQGALLSINSHNYYEGTLRMVDGIPQTSKADKNNHGFGLKSISMIVERYGGTVSYTLKNQVFNVNALIPILKDSLK